MVKIINNGKAIELEVAGKLTRYHAVWLRDNAREADTRDSGNGQRLITILDVAGDIYIDEASVQDDILQVRMQPEGKTRQFSLNWLAVHCYDRDYKPGLFGAGVELWQGGFENYCRADYQAISTDRGQLRNWLSGVARHGFAVVENMPRESGALCQVAELFGYVRETNYGRWFEVRSEVNPQNLAYTNLGLQAHTDNPYRDPVPTLQLLSCIENTVEGGESIVVDGFKVAEKLYREDPTGFKLLSQYPARFEFAGSKGVVLRAKRPMIELGVDGEVLAVRFNNRSMAAVTDVPFDDMEAYYKVYRRFAELVEDKAMQVSFKLAAGDLFIVDNTRVLHARSAFSGTGNRWLQGCYADKDGLLSTLASLEIGQQAAE